MMHADPQSLLIPIGGLGAFVLAAAITMVLLPR
jgi:hypothetical protein